VADETLNTPETDQEAPEAQPEAPAEQAEITETGEAEELSLEQLVAKLQDDVAAAEDAALRAQADAQNVKRRAEQEVERARKFALERFTGDLLPVVDNLERALESTSGDDEALKPIAEGVELTLKSFLDVMGKYQVAVVDPQGEPFDPDYHQAVSMVENNEVEPNTVIAVMQKGYTLNGRLVRAAMVMVSKSGG
jgi:molecular chaperone GrpE